METSNNLTTEITITAITTTATLTTLNQSNWSFQLSTQATTQAE
jgi:hypothetical protein